MSAPRTTPEQERALVDGLAKGRRDSVREFVERTHGPVYRMTARYTSNVQLREDWTHDVILRALEELRRGRFVHRRAGGLWAWFRQRANYLLLDRAVQLRRESLETDLESLDDVAIGGGFEDPSQAVEAAEARRIVEECMEGVDNPRHREALRLQMLEELSYEDVAEALAAPLNTVRSWIRRARIAVRRCVSSKYGLEFEDGA